MIKKLMGGLTVLAATGLFAAGCGPASTDTKKSENGKPGDKDKVAQKDDKDVKKDEAAAKIDKAIAGLPEAEQKLAREQKYCANEPENLLGSMGTPVKLMVKDTVVFVCCSHCEKDVAAKPDETLKNLKDVKAKAAKESKE
jgi:hypothetical protein